MFANRCMDKDNAAYAHSGVLFSHENAKIFFARKYIKLDIMLLSEISPIQKHKYLIFFYMHIKDM